jgi:hypothetical protein
MRIYLDDNCTSALLVRLLEQAGHDVQVPITIGLMGAEDPVHLTRAIRDCRAQMSYNYGDFQALHDLVMQAGGHHPGILVIRKDNDPRRDLTERGIVTCIARLLAAKTPIEDQYIILNHWR